MPRAKQDDKVRLARVATVGKEHVNGAPQGRAGGGAVKVGTKAERVKVDVKKAAPAGAKPSGKARAEQSVGRSSASARAAGNGAASGTSAPARKPTGTPAAGPERAAQVPKQARLGKAVANATKRAPANRAATGGTNSATAGARVAAGGTRAAAGSAKARSGAKAAQALKVAPAAKVAASAKPAPGTKPAPGAKAAHAPKAAQTPKAPQAPKPAGAARSAQGAKAAPGTAAAAAARPVQDAHAALGSKPAQPAGKGPRQVSKKAAHPEDDGAPLAGETGPAASPARAAKKTAKQPEAPAPLAQSPAPVPEPAPPLSKEDRDLFLAHQRELLFAERNNYTRQADELRAQAEALALEHEPGDVQFDEEGGEGGTANVDRELDLHLSAQAHAAIEEIDAALQKIEDGTYGFCESCGNPVPKARLEALPHARLCVSCKSGGLTVRRQ